MGTNSIRANLCEADIVSEIRLTIGADIKRENTFIIVEGQDDIKFWKGIATDKVIVLESYSGKEGVKDIIQNHFDSNHQVIGIRDRDYEMGAIHPKIFFYDYCCMEMMFVKCTDAFDSIYYEYYSEDLSSEALRNEMLNHLKYLSIIRKNSEINGWRINFKGLSISNAFDNEKKLINNSIIISKLNEMNKDYFIQNVDKLVIIEEAVRTEMSSNELLSITQGHDFLSLFAAICKKNSGDTASSKNISSSLRCAYRKSDFITSNLYNDLIEYESRYSLRIV